MQEELRKLEELWRTLSKGLTTEGVEELAQATGLVDYAMLAVQGVAACRKTIVFHLGEDDTCTVFEHKDPTQPNNKFTITSGISGITYIVESKVEPKKIFSFDLTSPKSVLMALRDKKYGGIIEEFLQAQIKKA